MIGKFVLNYTQGLAQIDLFTKTIKEKKVQIYRAFCDKKGCKEFDDFKTFENAYDHSMDHHNKYHRL